MLPSSRGKFDQYPTHPCSENCALFPYFWQVLKSLSVKNYALIRELDLNFDSGLSIITGETGAGKSILLGALGLVLGERAESNVVDGHETKCVVEAAFDLGNYALETFFAENELDFEPLSILRREISTQGKSRAFINDTPVSLNVLKDLGEQLIDIHSQHETISLKDKNYQIQLLDSFAQNQVVKENYRSALRELRKKKKELDELLRKEEEWKSEYEFNRFLFEELTSATLQVDEEISLEEEQLRLQNAAEITRTAFEGAEAIRNGEGSALDTLRALGHVLRQQSQVDTRFLSIHERLNSVSIELDDLGAELDQIAQNTVSDDQRLEWVGARLDLLFALQKKHRCSNSAELIEKWEELREKTARVEQLDEARNTLEKEVAVATAQLKATAAGLRDTRQKAIPLLQGQLLELLNEVGLPSSRMQIEMEPLEQPSEEGPDEIRILFSSNTGAALQPINKVASGGELSRVMLCLKSILARSKALPTLIFDEIDTGISGEVAAKVGRRMRSMASGHQVISITHLPQIAACGNLHYFVYKDVELGKTTTHIRTLNEDERVKEIARMLSGDTLSEPALQNARVLLAQN